MKKNVFCYEYNLTNRINNKSNFYNFFLLVCGSYELNKKNSQCKIPLVIRGQWYSWENGRSTTTEIDATSMSQRGDCIRSMEENQVNFTFVFKQNDDDCYTCVKFMLRTVNVLDKMESKLLKN